jgi:hypothetical protein
MKHEGITAFALSPVMKGHEDDGMFFENSRSSSGCETRRFRENP